MRNDIHSPSKIIPVDYEYCFSFSLASMEEGWPVPAINMDLVVELRRQGHLPNPHTPHKGTNHCDICGSWFKHGDVWKHTPTGEYITLGHICADKYIDLADRADWKKTRATEINKAKKREHRRQVRTQMAVILKENPGLYEAFKLDHYVTQDIRSKFIQYGNLSEKQIDLIFKLKKQADEKAKEILVPVPEGRLEVEGTIVSVKCQSGYYGQEFKMLVKVDTADGIYRVYGTMPISLADADRGTKVKFHALLQPKEQGFGYFSRPTKAEVVQ